MSPPLLEHQDVPQQPLAVVRTRKVFAPTCADKGWIEKAILGEAPFTEQLFRPRPQRTAKPHLDRHGKATFLAVYQRSRHVPVKDSAQEPFVLAGARVFERRHQAPYVFHDAMVKQRHADLKAEHHARPIHFGKNAVRQTCHHIEEAYAFHEVGKGGASRRVLQQIRPFTRTKHDGGRILRYAEHLAVEVVLGYHREGIGKIAPSIEREHVAAEDREKAELAARI